MINSQGNAKHVVRFRLNKGQSINTFLQLLEHRYKKTVPQANCQYTSITFAVHTGFHVPPNVTIVESEWPPSTEGKTEEEEEMETNVLHEEHVNGTTQGAPSQDDDDDDEEDADKSRTISFWSSLASLFDTSVLCEILPSLSMRLPAVKKESQIYSVIITMAGPNYANNEDFRGRYGYNYYTFDQIQRLDSNYMCHTELFVERIPSTKTLSVLRGIFAVAVPLLILVLPMIFLTRHAMVFQDFVDDFDASYWFWFPPLYARDQILAGGKAAFLYLKNYRRNRRIRQRDADLQRQHEDLQREAAAATVAVDTTNPPPAPASPTYPNEPSPQVDHTAIDPTTPLMESHPQQREEEEKEDAVTVEITEAGASGTENKARDMLFTTTETVDTKPTATKKAAADEEEEDEKVCRICRDGEEVEKLVTPCGCTGSVRYIHRSCLDKWRLESAKRNVNNFTNCEICKQPYQIEMKRSVLAWESSKNLVASIVLFLVCFVGLFVLCPLVYSTAGELSCSAPYHRVNYDGMYDLTGLFFSIMVYFSCTTLVLYAHLIVYTFFREGEDARAFFQANHHYPPFWTMSTKLKIFGAFLLLLVQSLSMGYLIKSFFYYTSNISWNWEISLFMGILFFTVFLSICMSTRVNIDSMLAAIRNRRAEEVTIVDGDDANANATPAPATNAGATAAAPANPAHSSINLIPPHDENDVDYTAHFNIPPEQRTIRAYDYCPPRPRRQRWWQ
ncbi:hypothetical protein AGDE_15828 [Angomonas deanei]|uniref:RING-variant domain containing protein, putative n=1 Tax=Angomonas deanei TaxID=59799 RepID=A0A7G2C6W2_9TRYP|nr:hypothetical protein AGDE_15828 [Angomonas deanei]CAD2213692.1 RING-variant domain containing protein, putative [Angomonas deanei]|eukprot:EPY18298.1 hypothetical protein AGDE_15828 [Angomonas deanei]